MHLLALRSSSLNSVDRAGIGGSRPRPPFSLYPNFEALSFHLVGSWEGGINPSNMDETRSCERATERPLLMSDAMKVDFLQGEDMDLMEYFYWK